MRAGQGQRRHLGIAIGLLGLFAPPSTTLAQTAPQTQCVASATAGGTLDAITIPVLPCALTTNLLILSSAGPNATTTPTLAPLGLAPQTIVRPDGTALTVGDLGHVGYRALLNPNGIVWYLLNPATLGDTALIPGTTTLLPSTSGGVLWDNAGVLADSLAPINTALATALPSLTTSQLYGGTGGTGVAQLFPAGAGVPAWMINPTSANLAAAMTNETGTAGSLVFSGSPALTGTPTAPTQTTSDTSTDIATDGFVNANLVVALPNLASTGLYGGTGVAGVAAAFTEAANTILGNATSGIAAPTALAIASCSTSASALLYTTSTGFSCNTAINAAQLAGATWASPPVTGFGSTTPEPVAATNFGWTGTASGKAIKANSASSVAAPTAPSSTASFLMQGLAGSITPSSSGNVLIIISGVITTSSATAGVGINYQISYGTGAAPTSNSVLAGTQVGQTQIYANPATVTAADVFAPFSTSWVVTGLAIGTTYWIDIAAKSLTTASATSLARVNIVTVEQ